MLYTTAAGLGEREVAELAQQHLRDYAGAVIRLYTLVPASVIRYLREEGLPVQESVLYILQACEGMAPGLQGWQRAPSPGCGAGAA